MSGGLSASEVGKEIREHAKHDPHERRDRLISITEAILLSVVALLAAWSSYAAAKWSTESRVELATASGLRIEASRADSDAGELRDFDSSTFESWFTAYTLGNTTAMSEMLSIFSIIVGIALLLTGIGLVILALAVFGRWRPVAQPAAAPTPVPAPG